MKKILTIALCITLLTGCATNSFTDRGSSALTYDAVLAESSTVIGREAMIGGRILSVQQSDNETHVEIMIAPLTTSGYPESSVNNLQRAIVVIPQKISVDGSEVGTAFTALGTVDSVDQGTRGFTVVLIRASEYKLWKKATRRYNNGADVHKPVGLTFSW